METRAEEIISLQKDQLEGRIAAITSEKETLAKNLKKVLVEKERRSQALALKRRRL